MAKKINPKYRGYTIVQNAVEAGTRYGYNRAFKYGDMPSTDAIQDQIVSAIMLELSEVINWDEME